MNLRTLLLLGAMGWTASAQASEPANLIIVSASPSHGAFPAPRVSAAELNTMRGGVLLPNGLDLHVGIDIQTRVDGVLVLHTLYASDGPIVGARLFTNGTAESQPVPAQTSVTMPGTSLAPVISVSRSSTGSQIAPGSVSGPTTVNIITDPQATWASAQGQREVPVTPNGPPVTTAEGDFRLTNGEQGAVASLTRQDLEIQHLIGRATGVVVANTASDRAIDTVSAVNIDLRGAEPLLAASQFLASALALETVRGR